MMQSVPNVLRESKGGDWPAASPTSVLQDDPCDFMADWAWESAPPTPSSQAITSPMHGSPLSRNPRQGSPLCSSGSSDTESQKQQNSEPAGAGVHKASRSLVEALQDCLTSLPQSSTVGDSSGRSVNNPTGATPSPSPSQQSSPRPAGKRRPRASRRTPTTFMETDPTNFRDMVQKLTGIPSAITTPGAVPWRPRPQRAHPSSSSSILRPDTLRSIRRLPPMGPPPRPPPPLPSPLLPFLQHLQQRSRTSEVIHATPVKPAHSNPCLRACKREFDQMEDQIASVDCPSSALRSPKRLMKPVMPVPMIAMPSSWWEPESGEFGDVTMTVTNHPFAMSTTSSSSSESPSSYHMNSFAKEHLLSGSGAALEFVPTDSADEQLAYEEQEFNFGQIESWLSAESMCE